MNDKLELWKYWFCTEWDKITQELKQYNHLDKIKIMCETEYKLN